MKKFSILLFSLLVGFSTHAQKLILNKTVWVGSDSACYNGVYQTKASKDGGILFTGVSSCKMDNGYIIGSPHSGGNVAIGKLDKDLKPLWIKSYGGSKDETPKDFVEMDNGDVFVLGHTYSTDGDIQGASWSGNIWLTKYNKNGDLLWGKVYGCPFTNELGSISTTSDGNLIISASVYGKGGDVDTQYDNNQFFSDAFILKVDTSGNILWKKSIGGLHSDGGEIVIARPNSYYLVCASSSHDNVFADTGWRKGMIPSISKPDIFIIKLDASGTVIWSRSYGGSEGEWPLVAFWDERDSTIVISGNSSSKDYIYSDIYKSPPFSQQSDNSFILKLDSVGNLKTIKPFLKGYRKEDFSRHKDGYIFYRDNFKTSSSNDAEIIMLNNSLDVQYLKKFGGGKTLSVNNSFQYKDGVLACGGTNATTFNEGIDVKTFDDTLLPGGWYFSYLHYFPVFIKGIQDQTLYIKLYPNPTNNLLKIELTPTFGKNKNLIIFNSIGKEIHKQKIANKHHITIDISAFANGVYHATVIDSKGKKHTATFTKN